MSKKEDLKEEEITATEELNQTVDNQDDCRRSSKG